MNNVWIETVIEGKKLAPVQVVQDNRLSVGDDMNMQSLAVQIKEKVGALNLTIIGYRGSTFSSSSVFFSKKKNMQRSNSFTFLLSRLFAGNSITSANVNVFYNIVDSETICVGFVSQKFESARVYVKVVDSTYGSPISKEGIDRTTIQKSAKELFVSNYNRFSSLMQELLTDKLSSEWVNIIMSIPDSHSLLELYSSYKGNPEMMLELMKAWGVKYDKCKSYPQELVNTDYYNIVEGGFDKSEIFSVISPCWTIWLDDNGHRIERVISKGSLKSI